MMTREIGPVPIRGDDDAMATRAATTTTTLVSVANISPAQQASTASATAAIAAGKMATRFLRSRVPEPTEDFVFIVYLSSLALAASWHFFLLVYFHMFPSFFLSIRESDLSILMFRFL